MSNIWDKTKKVSEEAFEATKNGTSKVWDKTKEFGSSAWDKTKNVFEGDHKEENENLSDDMIIEEDFIVTKSNNPLHAKKKEKSCKAHHPN